MRAPFSFMAPSGAAPFSPLSVSGCVLWYDAAHVTTGAGSPAPVTALPDQSGNGRDASITGTPFLTASNASYASGPTILRTDSTDQILSPDLGLTTGPFTLVFVGDAPAASYNYLLRFIGSGVGVDVRAQSSKYRASADGGVTELEDTVADTTVPVVLIVVYDGATSRLYHSSLTSVDGDAGSLPDLTGLGIYVGAPAADGGGNLNLRHALAWGRALTDDESKYLETGFGAGSGISIASFDRASLAATGYLIDYAGNPWTGTASAGTSGSHDFSNGFGAATVGANFGSHPSADFDGSEYLQCTTAGDLISAAAFSFHFVSEFDTASAPVGAGSEYQDPALISDITNGELFITFTSAGVLAGMYDGVTFTNNTTPIPLSTGLKACVQVKYDGTHLKCRVNGKDSAGAAGWESVASGNLRGAVLAHALGVGASYAAIGKIDGRIGLAMAFDTALSDADFDNLLADARANFGVP